MENNQGGGNKKVYVAIILLLLLINGVALYLLYSENKAKKDLGDQKIALEHDFKNLTDTLDAKKVELEQFKGKNVELDSMITAKQTEIETQKKTIAGLFAKGKMNKKELDEAKAKIAQYEASIADLQKKVEELTQKNQQLTSQNQQLTTDLTTEKQTTAALNQDLAVKNKKVELGSLLPVRNIEVLGIATKKNGKEVTEKKAKKTEGIKVSFQTGDNKVLEAGNVSIYLRIINPKGETISVVDKGSGTIKAADSGETIQYTKKLDFDYAQTNKGVSYTWALDNKDAGTYKVELYQSGYLIGKGELQLK
jgi:predicted  nucleic acid-binding Zn-ribbon protein